jgi:hypothetical protein
MSLAPHLVAEFGGSRSIMDKPVTLPSMVARGAHAGSGGDRGRRSAISRKISANSVLGAATSAIWKAT